jgi:hypothetical protein
MQQDRHKKQDCRDQRSGPGEQRTPLRMPARKQGGTERERDQEKDDQQAPVEMNIDTGEATHKQSRTHVYTSIIIGVSSSQARGSV